MISLRCHNNKKAGEVDPETLAVVTRCKTCSDVWGRPVYHHWPIGKILTAISNGQMDGTVLPRDTDIPLPAGEDT